MPDHVYKTVELVGSSSTSFDDAVNTAVNRAATTLRNLRWFQVVESARTYRRGAHRVLAGDAQDRLHTG